MRKAFRTITDVLHSPIAELAALRRKPAQKTDRVMHSSKLEDSIYAELREDDTEMDMTENAAAQRLKSFPALSRDVFQSLYSLAPRRNDMDMLTAAAQKFNAPILDHVVQQDDYPTLKNICEGRSLPAYEAAAEFTDRAAEELDGLLSELSGDKGALNTLEKLETARDAVAEELAKLLGAQATGETTEMDTMTFEELRIRKSEDFLDLEEGKNVSWSVEYGTIRKDVKDPKGTTIISKKESIERSREFLDALKKAKDKNPDCIVRPKVTMKNKGTAAYKGTFPTVEAARNSDKVICLIPGNDGHIYEMHKTEQGEFIAPKHKIIDFQAVAAGFTPALPLIPLSLMCQIIAFFRSFMAEHGQEYEALVLIYWDKWKEEYLAYVPKQNVSKAGIHASLQENPYDDESRYIHYADIHSHNSMEAFFSSIDDADERGTGIYMVLGHLDHFYPEIAARICCGGSFVDIDPGTVVEGLEEPFPPEWCTEVSHGKAPVSRVSPRKAEKTGIWGWKALDLLLGDLK